ERLAPLDLRVEDLLHVPAARVADDRAVAERARPPLEPPLVPPDDLTAGDRIGDTAAQLALVAHGLVAAVGGVEQRADLVVPERRPEIGAVARAPVVAELVPELERRADRTARVAAG